MEEPLNSKYHENINENTALVRPVKPSRVEMFIP